MEDITGQHVVMRVKDEHCAIMSCTEERRKVARLLLSVGEEFTLLCYGVVDSHLHLEIPGGPRRADELARRIKIGWRKRFPRSPELVTLRHKPIVDYWHLQRTCIYILNQVRHHNCTVDLYHDASALPDLLEMRAPGRYLFENREAYLQRVSDEDLQAMLAPVDLTRPSVNFDQLAGAAAAAVALPNLKGRNAETAAAKAAAVKLAGPHLPASAVAKHLGLSTRHVNRLRHASVDETLLEAVALQLRFRTQIAEQLNKKSQERISVQSVTPSSHVVETRRDTRVANQSGGPRVENRQERKATAGR